MTESPSPQDDTQVTPAAEPLPSPAAAKDKPEGSTPEVAPAADTPEGAPAVEEVATPAAEGAKLPFWRRRWVSIALDSTLVVLVIAVLAAAVYYFKLTTERYHVPTPMELLLSESERLEQRFNELLPKANQADTQLHLRARLAQLEGRQAQLSSLVAEKKASLDTHRGQVLAIQYAIRQADETNRSIARSLLPGMPVGNVTTTTGKAYRNATIYRLDKRYVYLRFPEGQVRFPIRHLVKDNLPELARYAFGELDLVDMSDFEQAGDAPAPTPTRHNAPAVHKQEDEGYDPAPGTPVLDADANRTTTTRVPEEGFSEQELWEAPTGDLPM